MHEPNPSDREGGGYFAHHPPSYIQGKSVRRRLFSLPTPNIVYSKLTCPSRPPRLLESSPVVPPALVYVDIIPPEIWTNNPSRNRNRLHIFSLHYSSSMPVVLAVYDPSRPAYHRIPLDLVNRHHHHPGPPIGSNIPGPYSPPMPENPKVKVG